MDLVFLKNIYSPFQVPLLLLTLIHEFKYESSILLLWLFWAICGRVSQAKNIGLCKVVIAKVQDPQEV